MLLGGSLLALSCVGALNLTQCEPLRLQVLADVSRTDADKFATVCGRHRDTGSSDITRLISSGTSQEPSMDPSGC